MGEKIDESQRSYVNVISFDDRAHKSTELIDDEEGAEVQINQQMDPTPTRVRRANSNYQPDLPINEKMVRKK